MQYKKFIGLNSDIVKIRTDVFITEQGFRDEFDETDKTCFHIVLYENETPVATCRYFETDGSYHIGRVAVVKEYRGFHLGEKIMNIAETEIRKCGGHTIEVSAQVRVKNFYEKHGFKEVGETYFDEYCEHVRMVKKL